MEHAACVHHGQKTCTSYIAAGTMQALGALLQAMDIAPGHSMYNNTWPILCIDRNAVRA